MCTYVRTAGRQVISAHACSSDPPSSPRKNRQRKKRLICFSAPHPWGGGGTHACKTIRTASRIPQKLFSKHSSNSIGTHVLSFFFCPLDVVQHHDQDLRQTSLPLLSSSSPFFKSVASTPFGRKGAGEERVAAMQLPVWVSGKKKGRESENLLLFLPACVCIVEGGGRRGAKDSVSPLLSANGQRCIEMPPNEPKEEKGDFLFC